jgi:hypothetical protein
MHAIGNVSRAFLGILCVTVLYVAALHITALYVTALSRRGSDGAWCIAESSEHKHKLGAGPNAFATPLFAACSLLFVSSRSVDRKRINKDDKSLPKRA